jgi:hypothetical protein
VRPIGAASVRPGTSTFPDTLATGTDTIRKPPSRNPPASLGHARRCWRSSESVRWRSSGNCLKSASLATECDWMLVSAAPDPPFGTLPTMIVRLVAEIQNRLFWRVGTGRASECCVPSAGWSQASRDGQRCAD